MNRTQSTAPQKTDLSHLAQRRGWLALANRTTGLLLELAFLTSLTVFPGCGWAAAPLPVVFKDRTAELGLAISGDGACWADVNNDGWVDLCAGGFVWRNNSGKNFTRLAEVGAVVAADFDNDGFVDLFSWSRLCLYRNLGGTNFVEVKLPKLPKTVSRGACWGDFNGDGWVDLYIGGFEDWDAGITYPSMILMNSNGVAFHLAWTDSRYRARGVTACDFNRDGHLDIYVSNYRLQPNLLWLNDGTGHFKDAAAAFNAVATSPGFEGGHSIGAAWGDFDEDGNIDLFAGNFAHVDNRGDQPKSRFLRNLGPEKHHVFEDLGTCGVFYQESYASPAAGDFDNDGRLDLFFTTVYGTASINRPNHAVLFRNQGKFQFADITASAKLADLPPTYQAAWGDFDNDGNLDLITAGKLFQNQGGTNHWIKVQLTGDGRMVNRSAIGAQVRLKLGSRILTRQVEAGTGEGNQNDLTLHFGLGAHAGPVDLEILWPGGKTQTISQVQPDRLHKVAFQATGLGGGASGTTYYVDSQAGRNTNTGLSPKSPWRDFSRINGQTLNPGERLLIKRGSVINQELLLQARGTADRWAEISAYGEGARPILRRNWQIGERCALIKDPDFLRVRGLVFSHAGKGLVVHYATAGHGGLVIEDCIAHHIEGIYREWTICSGIPEWRGYAAPTDDGFRASAGIAVSGSGRDITIRDCDLFQNSWGFWVTGERVNLDRVYVHHSYAFNSSPHPALLGPRDSIMQNCIFDASGYHAFAGTMGIMLGSPRNLTIRNCTFRNQPDSGSHDEGGIDFENGGDGCLIDRCTFEHNAGAAIEVLGLESPQPRNVEIRGSRFIQNNWAKKLGPGEIFIWGSGKSNPVVCCSTGVIRSNGCVLAPGVQFFTNFAPATTRWTLEHNATYASLAELEKAMPGNRPPVVMAGPDITTDQLAVRLAGSVSDDAKPAGSKLTARWELLSGPGSVTFLDQGFASGRAEFSRPGEYQLRLVGDDGELWVSDLVTVHILPQGVTLAKAWEFNTPLDKEGWTEADLGTQTRVETPLKGQAGTSQPVKYVAGGFYIVALENAPGAKLLSPDHLNLALNPRQVIRIRCQNHTPAAHMVVRFTTPANGTWDDAKSRAFAVTANDDECREYVVDMVQVPGWTGELRQLRLDLTAGEAATGTVRIDFIRIDNPKQAAR